MNEVGRDLNQRLEHEAAFMQARVRQPQELGIFLDVTVKQQIEIDRTWPVFHFFEFDPTRIQCAANAPSLAQALVTYYQSQPPC